MNDIGTGPETIESRLSRRERTVASCSTWLTSPAGSTADNEIEKKKNYAVAASVKSIPRRSRTND